MTATLTREQARTRFDELPLPSTSDEHWRFTSLRGFDLALFLRSATGRRFSPEFARHLLFRAPNQYLANRDPSIRSGACQ